MMRALFVSVLCLPALASAATCLPRDDWKDLKSILAQVQDCPRPRGITFFKLLTKYGYRTACYRDLMTKALRITEPSLPENEPLRQAVITLHRCPEKDTDQGAIWSIDPACSTPGIAQALAALEQVPACGQETPASARILIEDERSSGAFNALNTGYDRKPIEASLLRVSVTSANALKKIHEEQHLHWIPSSDWSTSDYWRENQINFGAMRNRVESRPFLCATLGAGDCLVATYMDEWRVVNPKGRDKNFNAEIRAGDQLNLNQYLTYLDARSDNRHWNNFSRLGYTKRWGRVAIEQDNIAAGYQKLRNGGDVEDFTKVVIRNPRGMQILPDLRKHAEAAGDVVAALAVDEASWRAYLMMIDLFMTTADHRLDSYPFADELVGHDSLLDINRLASELTKAGRWPKYKSLTPETRAKLGGVYLDRTQRGAWKVKGGYDHRDNVIWLDFSLPFYENVYVLYHELWHVAWSHSPALKQSVADILSLADQTSPDSLDQLRDRLYDLIRKNELLAIDQQIRLFHATGFMAIEWGGEIPVSAQSWHDSHLGGEAYANVLKSSDRPSGAGLSNKQRVAILAAGPLAPFMVIGIAVGEKIQDNRKDAKNSAERRKLDEAFWQKQLQLHALWFSKIYPVPNQTMATTPAELAKELLLKDSKFERVEPVGLSCDQVSRIRKALGENWRFGIPFPYKLNEPKCVAKPGSQTGNEGSHTGNEGSHTGNEGSHTDLDGFPSLDGSDIRGDSNGK